MMSFTKIPDYRGSFVIVMGDNPSNLETSQEIQAAAPLAQTFGVLNPKFASEPITENYRIIIGKPEQNKLTKEFFKQGISLKDQESLMALNVTDHSAHLYIVGNSPEDTRNAISLLLNFMNNEQLLKKQSVLITNQQELQDNPYPGYENYPESSAQTSENTAAGKRNAQTYALYPQSSDSSNQVPAQVNQESGQLGDDQSYSYGANQDNAQESQSEIPNESQLSQSTRPGQEVQENTPTNQESSKLKNPEEENPYAGTKVSDNKTGFSYLTILIILGVGIILISSGILIFRKKKLSFTKNIDNDQQTIEVSTSKNQNFSHKSKTELPKESQDQLDDFIKNCLQNKIPIDQIEKSLIKNSWPKDAVEERVSKLRKSKK